MQKAVQGQIFLDCFNPILENAIGPRVKEGKREPCELKVSDFDDVMYLLEVPVKQLNILKLSISMSGYKEAYSNGGAEMLATKYPGMAGPPSRAGYDLTLTVDLDQLPMPPDRLLKCLSEVKRNLLGAPFDQAFDALRAGNGASLSLTALPWRKTETIYIIPQGDRVTVIYAIDFPEEDERSIAKVYLMEFVDAQRVANNSPPCTFTPDPPLELRAAPARPGDKAVGYLSFVIFPQHLEQGRQERTVTLLTGFRNYLHYHLKATKTYMHMRMRKRVVGLLQVLKRAVPEEKEKTKKTAQGKAFSRA